jgi:hypothetical protein
MALTLTPNLTTITSADTASDGGTWLGNSGAADTEVKIQGAGAYTWMAVKNGRTSCTFTPTTNLDMSATGVHLYWWAMSAVAAFIEPFTEVADDPGYTLRLTDGSANYKEWRIAGSDTWGGEWKCFVLDVNSTTDVYVSSGSLILSDIDVITWSIDMSNSGNIRIIDNQWNDVVRFGTGLKATGTDFDLADMVADDESSSNKYGILEDKDGVIFSQGKVQIGDGATTTTFNSTDEALIFKDRNSDGEGQVASAFYELKFTGSGLTVDMDGLVCKGAGTTDTTRYIVDADDTDITLDIAGSTFIRASTVGFAAGDSIKTSVFNDCKQINPSTSIFNSNTISNSTTTSGALLFPSSDGAISDLTFINCDNGVEYDSSSDSSSPSFDNFVFDDVGGNYDVNNTSGSSVSIAKTNGANPNSYNPAGSPVTFTASFNHVITGLELNTEITYVTAGTSTQLFHVENASVSDGDGKYKTTYGHGGGASVDILIHHVDFQPDISNIIGITLPNAEATVKVQMFEDLNYNNP